MAIAVARTGETRSPGSKKCRNARKKPHTARATPARCTTASATPAASGRPAQARTERRILRDVEEVAAVHVEDSLERHHEAARERVQMRQRRRRHRGDPVPAQGADQPHGDLGRGVRQGARRDQRQLVPLRGQGPAVAQDSQQDAGTADHGERHDRGQQRHPVGDDDPGQHRPGRDRDIPAPRRPVQHQKDQQQRQLGTQVIRLRQQQVRRVPELRREHDPRPDRQADQPLPPRRAAPGQQPHRQHQQRIGDSARDVDHIGAQPPEHLHERVLRDLGRVVRHVPEGPAVQQPVPVQHVPALQRLVRAVRGSGIGPGHPQVGNEQHDSRPGEPGSPYPPGPAPASEFFPGQLPSRNAGPLILDRTLTRRTGETSNHAQTLAEHQRHPAIAATTRHMTGARPPATRSREDRAHRQAG